MISIVTAYYNRKALFRRTLESVAKSQHKDFEVVAVDDASKQEERIEDLEKEFSFLRVIRIDPKDKWYYNSCIPYNIGIKKAKGDIIILQNPECLHAHDVMSYVKENLTDKNYLVMSCYSVDEDSTRDFIPYVDHAKLLRMLPMQIVFNYTGWYCHSKYNPHAFHFCSAITTRNMEKLGGFDERYSEGIGYEDNEFLDRVIRLGLKIKIVDDVSVIHQWHPKVYDLSLSEHHNQLYCDNALLHRRTKKERIIKVTNNHDQ
jgi:GT2 family glycosyltransferase